VVGNDWRWSIGCDANKIKQGEIHNLKLDSHEVAVCSVARRPIDLRREWIETTPNKVVEIESCGFFVRLI
jgi:hypothetical protein